MTLSKQDVARLGKASCLISFLATLCYTLLGTEIEKGDRFLLLTACSGSIVSFIFKAVEEILRVISFGGCCDAKIVLNMVGRISQVALGLVANYYGKGTEAQVAAVVTAVLNCLDALIKREKSFKCGLMAVLNGINTVSSFATSLCFVLKGLGVSDQIIGTITLLVACISFMAKFVDEFRRSCCAEEGKQKFDLVKAILNFFGRGGQVLLATVMATFKSGAEAPSCALIMVFTNMADASVERRKKAKTARLIT